MNTSEFKSIVLTASEGMMITQVEDVDILKRAISDRIVLGKNSSPNDWKEISKEEGIRLLEEQDAARRELMNSSKE